MEAPQAKKPRLSAEVHLIPDDCLLSIFQYLSVNDMTKIIQTCKYWRKLAYPALVSGMKQILADNAHLSRITEKLAECSSEDFEFGHYVETPHFKPSAVAQFFEDPKEEIEGYKAEEIGNDEKMRVPFGSPLCKGTFEAQFDLLPNFSPEEYLEAVAARHGRATAESIAPLLDRRLEYLHKKRIHEQEQEDLYLGEIGDAFYQEQLSNVRVDGADIPYYDSDFDNVTAEPSFMKPSITRSTACLMARGGIKYYEPSTMLDAYELLKQYVRQIMDEAIKIKFGSVEKLAQVKYNQPEEEYEEFFTSNEDKISEFDEFDVNEKLDCFDIEQAVLNITKKTFFSGSRPVRAQGEKTESGDDDEKPNEADPSTETTNNASDQQPTEEKEYPYIGELDELDIELITTNTEHAEQEAPTSPLPEEEQAIVTDPAEPEVEFIDNSALNALIETGTTSKEPLEEQLIQISKNIHEEIYGKEKTEQEKLHLKNWFANSSMLYHHAPIGKLDHEYKDLDIDYDKMTEQEIIELEKQEDIDYYGFSLYEQEEEEDETENEEEEEASETDKEVVADESQATSEAATTQEEQSSEEQAKLYHLRRLLREQSFSCIRKVCGFEEIEEVKLPEGS